MKRTRTPRTPTAKPLETPISIAAPPAALVDKRVKVTFWIKESVARAMKHEGIDRNMSFGELVEEAISARTVSVIRHG